MARQINNNRGWIEVQEGVSYKVGTGGRISINWFGAVIHGIRVVRGKTGLPFLSWPAFKGKEGEFIKTAYVYARRGSDDEAILNKILDAVK